MGGSIIIECCSRSGRSQAAWGLNPKRRQASGAVDFVSGRHEGVAKEAEVGPILNFFCKDIDGVACD